ncbi:NUMOD4 domain-containing protein [Solibacillus sp. FSL W8-0474]|uniref:NUMOD4 domain-containing protein n=1 Tax=Solibacillus sp. FSL W8-0474 TaxID=2975336 RepID=UPI0030FD0356
MLNNEVWKDVAGYENLYMVSDTGRVFSKKSGVVLKTPLDRYGYQKVSLYSNKKYKYTTVHRLVAKAFIPNPDNKETVNHKDGNKTNNHVSNLEWATSGENTRHAHKNGLIDYTGDSRRKGVRIKHELQKKKIEVTDLKTGVSEVFNSMKGAADSIGQHSKYFSDILRRGRSKKYKVRLLNND